MDDIVVKKRVPASQEAARPAPVRKTKKWNVGLVVVSILFVAALAVAVVFFVKYQHIKSDPSSATAQQTTDLVNRVSKLMTVPSNETPTVATVSDKSKLSSQPFFKNAQNGDELLIYTNAKQAIIYRPSTNKIINVGPIAITDTAGTPTR